jgi:hypothetical protein
LSALFEGAEVMMVGVCFESKVRVDLLLQASDDPEAADVKEKAAQFSRAFAQETVGDDGRKPQLKNLNVEANGVRASIVLSNDEFVLWKSGQVSRDQASLDVARRRAKN